MIARSFQVALRLTEQERDALTQAAERSGLPLSAWIRLVALTAAGDRALLDCLRRVDRFEQP